MVSFRQLKVGVQTALIYVALGDAKKVQDTRNLALFVECALMQEQSDRVICCNERVQSAAGRDFCYTDVIYSEDAFAECDEPTFSAMFACCTDLAKGNLDLEYDCRTSLPGGGQCLAQQIPCVDNYVTGMYELEEADR